MTNLPKAFGSGNTTAKTPSEKATGSGIDSILNKKSNTKTQKAGNNINAVIFKNGTFILVAISLFSWLMIFFDLQPSNGIFSLFGKTKNTYISYQSEQRNFEGLQAKKNQLALEAKTKSKQIEEKKYNVYIQTLEAIYSHRIPWFDEYLEADNGEKKLGRYGILDIPDRLARFFENLENLNPSEVEFTKKELIWKEEMTGSNLEVTSFSAGRSGINMGIKVSTTTKGNTFHLANFVKNILNSFNVLKNADIFDYGKTRDSEGNETESMSFSLPLQIQSKGEYDVNDSQAVKYEKFLKKYSKDKKEEEKESKTKE